ncbi:MAG: tRNA dihydrouridine synthase DusB [Lachnospiraceae bacterium]|nr:tRNA dihydrouridine synthase DusB [Lachnospiraceae bacterium]
MTEFFIGNVKLKNNIILGPMAGVSDLPFRVICSEMGAGLVCTEMVSAKAIVYKNKNTIELLQTDKREHPVSLQIFGSDPEAMAEATRMIEDRDFEILDINMGCPVPKVVNNGDGSALMKNPILAGKVIEAVAKNTSRPVTVKIRKGFDDDHVNAPEMAHVAEESGAKAVAVHGRTREQYYAGKADWQVIRAVKEKVKIPVIGNGDLNTAKDVLRMKEETGCDGFMIARGAQGNPWIFKEIISELEGNGPIERPSSTEIGEMILRHGRALIEFKGEYTGIREMRKHTAWYTSGLRNSSKLRGLINEVNSYDELAALIDKYMKN